MTATRSFNFGPKSTATWMDLTAGHFGALMEMTPKLHDEIHDVDNVLETLTVRRRLTFALRSG